MTELEELRKRIEEITIEMLTLIKNKNRNCTKNWENKKSARDERIR